MIEENVNEHDRKLEEFMEWIRENKALPQNLDAILLHRYLAVYEYKDLTRSQELLLHNLSLRKSAPNIFTERDVFSEQIQKATKTMQLCSLPNLTADGSKVLIIRLLNDDAKQFDYVATIKMVLMAFDAHFTEYDDDNKTIAAGRYFIIDGKGISFRHFMEIVKNFSTARVYMRYLQEAAPFNIKELHFINGSSIVDRIFSLIRPILKKDLLNVIHFHGHDIESLHNHVAANLLPSEYGGSLGPIETFHKQTMEILERKRNYIRNDDNWKVSER